MKAFRLDVEVLEERIAPGAIGNPGNNNPGENNTNNTGDSQQSDKPAGKCSFGNAQKFREKRLHRLSEPARSALSPILSRFRLLSSQLI